MNQSKNFPTGGYEMKKFSLIILISSQYVQAQRLVFQNTQPILSLTFISTEQIINNIGTGWKPLYRMSRRIRGSRNSFESDFEVLQCSPWSAGFDGDGVNITEINAAPFQATHPVHQRQATQQTDRNIQHARNRVADAA
jgi:hypothetical protein